MFVITGRSVPAGRLRNGSAPNNFECKAEKILCFIDYG